MAAGLLAVAAAAVVLAAAAAAAAALPVLADDKECFENCFKHCVGNDKSMTDYCNYACGMTCGPNDHALRRPLAGAAAIAGLPINCQLACVRESCHPLQADGKDTEACYGQCYRSCKTKGGLPRPLGAGTVRPPAALPDHRFHKMQDAVQPTAEPDPDDVGRRARGPLA